MPVVAELAELRKMAGVSQRRLAREVGLGPGFGQSMVSLWESGSSIPTVGHAAAYARVFGHRIVVQCWDDTVVGDLLEVWPRLAELRQAEGLSQRGMAAAMFVGQTAVHRTESTAGPGTHLSTAVLYLGVLGFTVALHPEVTS